jgi:hypothetical protein
LVGANVQVFPVRLAEKQKFGTAMMTMMAAAQTFECTGGCVTLREIFSQSEKIS